jgi:hypothetical protein
MAKTKLGMPQWSLLVLFSIAFTCCSPPAYSQALASGTGISPAGTTSSDTAIRGKAKSLLAQLPLRFEKNEGQSDPQVRFLSQNGAYSLFLTPKEAMLLLPHKSSRKAATKSNQNAAVVRLRLVGASANPRVIGVEEFPGKTNYFVGTDPKKWHTNVSNYARVKYEEVYPGVDLAYYGNQGGLEYDFTVAPGADANHIRFEVVGEPSSPPLLRLAPNGDLIVTTSGDEVRMNKPVVYQPSDNAKSERQKAQVSGHFVLEANSRVSFRLGPYNHSKRLIIDPAITYSTYLGGSYNSNGNSVAVYTDPVTAHVYAYIAGGTCDVDFPTKNALQPTFAPQGCAAYIGNDWVGDAFVAKIDPSVSGAASLIWSTYLGGSDNAEFASAIAVDGAGNVYLTGNTNSLDFPTVNAFQPARKSTSSTTYYPGTSADAFLSKLSADGSTLLYSTYFGGSKNDDARALALDSANHVYIAGGTDSSDLSTRNAYQSTLRSTAAEGFLAIFDTGNAAQQSLLYSTYLGGSNPNHRQYGDGILTLDAGRGPVGRCKSRGLYPVSRLSNRRGI